MANSAASDLEKLRHSAAHLLAAAVLDLYPNAKPTIGPAIEDGFYYDFDFAEPISDKDLPKIEKKMRQMVKNWQEFVREEVDEKQALEHYSSNEYKQELIKEFAGEGSQLTIYRSGDFADLCRGGHVEHPNKELKHFRLLSVAGAYWRGDESNKMLTRIYGTAFFSKEELEENLQQRELAKERDHRKIGKDLGLFVFSQAVGKGLPLWTEKGAVIRRELERFIVDEEISRGYKHVYTPDIANLDLYRKSGHYPYYQDSMYAPIKIDDEEYMLRPMTCPHHFELFDSSPHSYKELPLRYAELAKLYRYEQSGELSGLIRVRSFCLADAHIFCMKSQAEAEVSQVLDLIEYVAGIFGLQPGEDYHYRLSLGDRDNSEKYFKDDEAWDEAEAVLRKVLQSRDAHFVEAPDEAAFYGPKIDVQMKNVNGKEDTAFTNQYDFVMPRRFDLKYINEQGEAEQPVVIHRSSIGAVERTIAFLIERYGGKFPLWLAPEQVRVLPIADSFNDFAQEVVAQLRARQIRASVDDRSERLSAKIRDAQVEQINYMLIVGEKEVADGTVTVRQRDEKNQETLEVSQFVNKVVAEVAVKK